MPLSVGDKLGPYEILAPLGAGGMGEVYQARDTRVPVVDTFIVGRSYEVSNDGQRFLLRALPSGANAPALNVVLNWQAQLKK